MPTSIDSEPLCSSGWRAIDLEPLLRPRSVAVLGASDRPSPGRMIIESLDRIPHRSELGLVAVGLSND